MRTSTICAAGVTPVKRSDRVKERRSGNPKDRVKAASVTKKNKRSGAEDAVRIPAYTSAARAAPPTAPDKIGRSVKGGKFGGTRVSLTAPAAIARSSRNAIVAAINVDKSVRIGLLSLFSSFSACCASQGALPLLRKRSLDQAFESRPGASVCICIPKKAA